MSHTLVKIVTPIYKIDLSAIELCAFAHNMQVLSRYPHVLVVPEDLDVADFLRPYPNVQVVRVSPAWLGRQNSISGYNAMMTSGAFYDLFVGCEYILICQTDAWIFRDELAAWCGRGFDYVGAPWLQRDVYSRFPVKQWLWLRRKVHGHDRLHVLRQQLFDRVGNGGLSLRRVDNFRHACRNYADEIAYFATQAHQYYNEDVFWSLIPREFCYPSVKEALTFSFDVKPDYCYRLNGEHLPFGCHGLTHPRTYQFWKEKIPELNVNKTSCAEE